mmetsp:Transcript_26140/g.69766  ORF Transcript_26140/g.69766 Transcript_26140/m.69766 type:complete len:159 (+) Transcript_26140:116-592(+)
MAAQAQAPSLAVDQQYSSIGPQQLEPSVTLKRLRTADQFYWYVKCDQCGLWTCVLDTGMSLKAMQAAAGFLCHACCQPPPAQPELDQKPTMFDADEATLDAYEERSDDGARTSVAKKQRAPISRGPLPQGSKSRQSRCPACKGKHRAHTCGFKRKQAS